MKHKVKKYAKGMLTDSSGNPVRSGSGEVVRTRSDDEIAEDSKFGGYGRNMPKTKSYSMDDVKSGLGRLLGGKSSPSEDRPTSSGVEDYASMGKRAGVTSPFLKENISEETQKETVSEPDSVAGKGARNLATEETAEVKPVKAKKKVIQKTASQSFPVKDEGRGSQSFPIGEGSKILPGKPSKGFAKGGKVSSASSRGDGIAQRGKTRGKMC